MDKLKEILGDELYNQVLDKLKDTDIKLDGKVPYDRFNEVNTKKSELIEQVKQLQAEIDSLKTENEKLTKNLSAQNITAKVDDILRESGAKNLNTLKKLLDISNVQDTEDSLNAFKTTVDALKQSDPYLFNNNQVTGNIPNNSNAGNSSISKEDFHKMTYEEKAALYKRDKALYDNLKGVN